MSLPDSARFGVALLALAIAMVGLPGVGLADDDNDKKKKKDKQEASQQTIVPADARPDLAIRYDGFAPNVDHTVTFKVTNVGTARSTAIKAQIQTLSGGPPNLYTPDVPALAPGQDHVLFYGIVNCNGHVVRATVNDPLDFPSVNDRAEVEVCPDFSALPPIVPESPPVIVAVIEGVLTPEHRSNDPLARAGADGADLYEAAKQVAEEAAREAALPEYMRRGSHNVVLQPSYVWSSYRDHFFESGGCGPYSFGSSHSRDAVGWLQAEENDDFLGIEYRVCAYIGEAEMVLGFPYDLFDEIPSKRVTRAILSFEEYEGVWRDGKNHCVTTLKFGPQPYLSGPDGQVVFTVTEAVAELVSKGNQQLRVGWEFVLLGALRLDQLEAEGSSSCMSLIRNPRLQVYYDVP